MSISLLGKRDYLNFSDNYADNNAVSNEEQTSTVLPTDVDARISEVMAGAVIPRQMPSRRGKVTPTTPFYQRRRVYPNNENLSPSLSATSTEGNVGQKLAGMHHAYMRIQIFYHCALAMKDLAVRSDSTRRDIEVLVGNARKQCGKATQEGMHACHSNAAAGSYDNLRQLVQHEILTEKKITPQKRKYLLSRGLSDVDLACLIKLSVDQNEFSAFYNHVWPARHQSPNSSYENTSVDFASQATVELDRDFNLGCDRGLETFIRPKVCELYEKVMKGVLSPENATREFHDLVKEHFTTAIPCLQQKLTDLKTYELNLEILHSESNTTDQTLWKRIIDESVELKRKLKKKIHPGARIVQFTNVGDIFRRNKSTTLEDVILSVKTNVREKYDTLVEQIKSNKEYLEKQLEFAMISKTGTTLPDFELLEAPNMNGEGYREPITPHPRKKQTTQGESSAGPSSTSTESTNSSPVPTADVVLNGAAVPEAQQSTPPEQDPSTLLTPQTNTKRPKRKALDFSS